MPTPKMHADEIDIKAGLVRRLLEAQFPQWAGLPLAPVASAGTDNALFRLGENKVIRLPRYLGATGQVEKEHHWLPNLAPHLPLDIPTPLAKGAPAEGYPFTWAVHSWLKGQNATLERLANPDQAAEDLAAFIAALQRVDPTSGPPPGPHNFGRGLPLAERDTQTRAAISSLHSLYDTDALTTAWEAALQAPLWDEAPVWIHGDLQSGNLLVVDGRLSAVIDLGGLGVGDPACDLAVAWNLFSTKSRETFRAALEVDEATWRRGRGWALSIGLIALPYYVETNPTLAGIARFAIAEVLEDWAQN